MTNFIKHALCSANWSGALHHDHDITYGATSNSMSNANQL
jgi:hypothetical protein